MKNKVALVFLFILLTIILISSTGCYTPDKEPDEPKTAKIVGEIVYLDYATNNLNHPEDHNYCVYILPVGQEESGIWVPFTVNIDTETETEFSTDPTEMPELSIGKTVEIEYNTEEISDYWTLPGYEAYSIKIAASNTAGENNLPFSVNEDYTFDTGSGHKDTNTGKVVHVAKVDELRGYIIYLDETSYGIRTLAMYWVDEGTVVDDEIKSNLESGATGYWVKIIPLLNYPFNNLSISSVPFVEKIER